MGMATARAIAKQALAGTMSPLARKKFLLSEGKSIQVRFILHLHFKLDSAAAAVPHDRHDGWDLKRRQSHGQ